MLRTLLRFFSFHRPADQRTLKGSTAAAGRSQLDDGSGASVVLYAHVPGEVPLRRPAAGESPPFAAAAPAESHRQRLLGMRLEHLRLCSLPRCQKLASVGIETADDLVGADLDRLVQRLEAPPTATRILKRYRRAIHFAASVPGMTPHDAVLLISIHRRSIRGLAVESPVALHRDLQRFALSTKGQRQLRGRRLPSVRRIRRWIEACSHPVGDESATRQPGSLAQLA